MLHEKIKDKINHKSHDLDLENNFERFINETISKFDYNLEKFNYNGLIASIYETYNFLNNILESKINGEILLKNYIKILAILSPISSLSSVGNGPLPTLVVYALKIPKTLFILFGAIPRPVQAPAAVVFEDVT